MRRAVSICLGVTCALLATPSWAQWYMQSDPCGPPPTTPGYIILLPPEAVAQRAAACQQQRDAIVRRQQAEIAAAQAQAAEAEARVRRHDAALTAAQSALETSPDNLCRTPDTARNLMEEFNGMDWPIPRKVVDIEHLVTVRKDATTATLVCHGYWVLTSGPKIEGTMTLHPNVAGDIIVHWEQGHWEPTVSDWQPPISTVTSLPSPPVAATTTTTSAPSTAFAQGLADRKALEDWFASSSGDYHVGALYWAAQRSLPHPGSCAALGGDRSAGCFASQGRLATSDVRRKTEPDYRQGWNSYTP
jgi:hypothetical protein